MAYLLDSDTLIQASQTYYKFNRVPKFWRWIEQQYKEHSVFSIYEVQKELSEIDDELKAWSQMQPQTFFIRPDKRVLEALPKVADWVQNNDRYEESAKNKFFQDADFFLVGTALAFNFTVVTMEKHADSVRSVMIPSVCRAPEINIECIDLFALLDRKKAEF